VSKKAEPPPVVASAERFAAELHAFGEAARQLQNVVFTSQKGLQRGAALLQKIASINDALDARMREMADALQSARVQQESEAELVKARGEELARRTDVYRELLERYASVGREAAELNQGLGGVDPRDPTALPALDRFDQRMAAAMESMQELGALAGDKQFEDVAELAASLRQQIAVARGRLNLLRKQLQPN
jgi:hypothetical protein